MKPAALIMILLAGFSCRMRSSGSDDAGPGATPPANSAPQAGANAGAQQQPQAGGNAGAQQQPQAGANAGAQQQPQAGGNAAPAPGGAVAAGTAQGPAGQPMAAGQPAAGGAMAPAGGAVAGVPPQGNGGNAAGMPPQGTPTVAGTPPQAPPDGFIKKNIYMVSSTSASVGPGESRTVSVSCQLATDAMIEHRCSTDSKCGALFDDGFSGKTGDPDMTSCGVRNTCGKGTITIQAQAACYHF